MDHWEPGFWVARGWDREGHVATTRRSMPSVRARPGDVVEVGGIASPAPAGLSRVEVRVDEGEWQPAQIREPMSGTTWVVWRAWTLPGNHAFMVRAYDGQQRRQEANFHTKRSVI